MDIVQRLKSLEHKPISCIEMHTCGEPTRIIIDGYPETTGTLLEQRAQARIQYDHIRQRVILEPRGHYDMYGAVLRSDTELTRLGQAHMGVIFMTNNGYSTMCGHATLALGRFLLDTHDLNVFPRRNEIVWDRRSLTASLNLHAPCGLLSVSVPVNQDGSASDPNRPVRFVSVPSFAPGLDIPVKISDPWHQLQGQETPEVICDFAYGGAFYSIVHAKALGFTEHLQDIDMGELSIAAHKLQTNILAQTELNQYYRHSEEPDLSFLYGVIVVDGVFHGTDAVPDAEIGVCFFADRQIDRSPCGSGVAARSSLAYCKGEREIGMSCSYHSRVSVRDLGPCFVGTTEKVNGYIEDKEERKEALVHVNIQGRAFYTGTSTFSVEQDDPLGDSGFVLMKL